MHVAVPFDAVEPKSRLAPVLDADERDAFARIVLEDVLAALSGVDAAARPTVYATAPVDVDADVVVDERGLDPLVGDLLAEPPVAVVMADLALATTPALERLLARDGDVVLAPGRGGGTNALVVREPGFSVDFHGVSLRDHRELARDAGLDVAEVDSMRLATDVDEPADLVEVLLHGEGRAPAWLHECGFRVVARDGRATVTRE